MLNVYYGPGTILGPGHTRGWEWNRGRTSLFSRSYILIFWWREKNNIQINKQIWNIVVANAQREIKPGEKKRE